MNFLMRDKIHFTSIPPFWGKLNLFEADAFIEAKPNALNVYYRTQLVERG